MLNSLDALIIAFFAMSLVSILGVLVLFLSKNEKLKKGIFYGLSLWGVLIAYCNIQTVAAYSTGGILIAGVLGVLAIAAILINLCSKKENHFKLAQILTVISVVAGMIDTFLV